MEYELTPIKPLRVGKDSKMSKSNTNVTPEAKTSRKYAKTRGEHFKDIVIAILVTSVIAFIGGMHFSNSQHAETERAVKAATISTAAEVKK